MRAEETEEEIRKVHPWNSYLATGQYTATDTKSSE